MFDLLSTLPEVPGGGGAPPMTVLEDNNGVYVKGLSCHLAQNEEEALNLLFEVSSCMVSLWIRGDGSARAAQNLGMVFSG